MQLHSNCAVCLRAYRGACASSSHRPDATAFPDLDGNEQLDPVETMALFKSELDKLYNGSDADPREREEEMNQMRETTYREVDVDKDGLIR